MLMEVNIIYVTFILVNVLVKMELKVQNVINVKMAIMDFLQMDVKVSLRIYLGSFMNDVRLKLEFLEPFQKFVTKFLYKIFSFPL